MKVPEPKKQPSGNWFIQMRFDGESIPVTAPTAKECRDRAMLIKAEYKAGKRVKSPNKSNITLRQAINNYIDARDSTLSPATIRGYKIIRDNRFKSVMDKKLKDIKDWQSICNDEAKLYSPKSLKNSYRFVESVIKEATGTPAPKVTLPQVVPNEKPFLEPEQIKIFIKAIHGEPCEIPALLGLSSLRRSEICALDWKNVDLKKRRILVSGSAVYDENQKLIQKQANKNTSSRRYVPIMMNELFDALNACKNKTGYVVTCNPNTIWAQVNRICKENNLPCIGTHGLRHSFASLTYHLGVPEKIAMQIGGWSDRDTMSKIYTHLAQADISKYETKLTDFFNNANENANSKQET